MGGLHGLQTLGPEKVRMELATPDQSVPVWVAARHLSVLGFALPISGGRGARVLVPLPLYVLRRLWSRGWGMLQAGRPRLAPDGRLDVVAPEEGEGEYIKGWGVYAALLASGP